jgi:hypothetical protein
MSLLDLVPGEPIRSVDPFDFRGQPARWRLLDGLELVACRTAGQKKAMEVLMKDHELPPDEAFQLLQSGTSRDTEREWFEHYILGAAMTDKDGRPIAEGTPDEVARRLADILIPLERARFINDYLSFADEKDPNNLTDEEIEEILATAGKQGDASIWLRYGSNSLRSLLHTLAPRLLRAEMALAVYQEQETMEARVARLEAELGLESRD